MSTTALRLETRTYPRLFELGELYDLPMVFKEETWNALVDHVAVHEDGRIVFAFKNGTEVTKML